MKNIIVATDLSARSDRALDRAEILAKQYAATLHVVHVIDEELPTSIAEMQQKNGTSLLEKQLAGRDTEATIHFVFGDPWKTILELSKKLDADLVVLGTHRALGVLERFRGTTVARVSAATTKPLLVVGRRVSGPFLRPVVGVDFSDCARAAANIACELAPDQPITLVNAYHIPYRALTTKTNAACELSKRDKERAEAELKGEIADFEKLLDSKRSYQWQLIEGTPIAVLVREVKRLDADLVCVGTHARSWLSKALLGSTAEALLSDPPCDVLVAPLLN